MPMSSIFCIVLAWFVALGGTTTGVSFLFDGRVNAMVSVVLLTLFVSIALIMLAVRRDPRCDGFYEISSPLDVVC
jgi:hypothetical protein